MGRMTTTCQWNLAISSYRSGRHDWDVVLDMVAVMRQLLVKPDTASLNMAVAAHQRSQPPQWRPALHLLAEFGGMGLRKGLITFNTCMCFTDSLSKPFWPRALSFLGEVAQREMEADEFSFSGVMRALSKGGNYRWPHCLELLSSMSRCRTTPNIVVCNSIISASEGADAWAQGLCLLGKMQLGQILPDVVTLTSMLSSCQENWMKASNMLRELRPVRPNLLSCNALLSSCTSASKWQDAVAWFVCLPNISVRPDTISVNSLAGNSDARGFWRFALHLIHGARFCKKAPPDEISYNSAMASSANAGSWKIALGLSTRMRQMRVTCTVVSLGRTVCAWRGGSQWHAALVAFSRLTQDNIRANLIAFNNVLDACDSQWLSAAQLLQAVRLKGLGGNAVSYSTVANALARGTESGIWQRSLDLWHGMINLGVISNEVTHNSVINACEGSSWNAAIEQVFCMEALRITPNLISLNSAIAASQSESCWLVVLDLLHYMPMVELFPDLVSHVNAADACARAGQVQATLRLLHICDTNSWSCVSMKTDPGSELVESTLYVPLYSPCIAPI